MELIEGSGQRLADFWEYLCKDSMIESNPFFKPWWDYWHAVNRETATGEAQDDFIRLRSLQRMEYRPSFILLFHHLTRGFFNRAIHGSSIVTNH